MNNEELLIQLVREIHDDQKEVVKSVHNLTLEHAKLKADIESGRNGYTPHEVVELLHWVDTQKNDDKKTTDGVKTAVINWLVPILLSALVIGLVIMTK